MRRLCAVDGCEHVSRARGWCVTHYERWRRYGDPLGRSTFEPVKTMPDLDALGITYRQLDYWTRCGLLQPDAATPGSGNRRVWTDEELMVAARAARLHAAGLTLGAAFTVARGGELSHGVKVEMTA